MAGNSNRETRAQLKRRFNRFARLVSVNDMRPEESTRRHRAAKYERKHRTYRQRPAWVPEYLDFPR